MNELTVDLEDGRALTVPLAWYPRLVHGNQRERSRWRLLGRGLGIHWPDLDEDIRVGSLLPGRRSTESQESLKCWLATRVSNRSKKKKPTGRRTRRD